MKNTQEKKLPAWFDFRAKRWAVLLAVFLIIIVGVVASYPLLPAPKVEGYSLRNNVRKVAYNAPLKISFDQKMDQGSVEKAFSVTPALEGTFEWKGNVLNYKPSRELKIGETFEVRLVKSAKSLIQKQLPEDYQERFMITDSPKVVLFSPADKSQGVPADAKITVMFDRPMVSLTTLNNGQGMLPKVQIQPSVSGKMKWLGTSSFQFIPDKLNLATEYTFTIPKGVESAEGGLTDADSVIRFETLRPNFVTGVPGQGSYFVKNQEKIKITFDQAVDQGSLKQAVKVMSYTGDICGFSKIYGRNVLGCEKMLEQDVAKGFNEVMEVYKRDPSKWEIQDYSPSSYNLNDYKAEQAEAKRLRDMQNIDEEKAEGMIPPVEEVVPTAEEFAKSVLLTPQGGLKPNRMYLVVIGQGVKGKAGTLSSTNEASFHFAASGEFRFLSSTPVNNNANAEIGAVSLNFSNPLNLRSVQGKILIEPKSFDADKLEIQPQISTDNNNATLNINYKFKPSTQYKVVLKSGFQNAFGAAYTADIEVNFKTKALDPSVSLQSGSDIQVLDFNTPSLFYVKSANSTDLDVQLKALSADELRQIYGNGYVNVPATFDTKSNAKNYGVKIQNELNQFVFTALDLDKVTGAKLTPGAYYMEIRSPQVKNERGELVVTPQVFMVNTVALAVKPSSKEMLVWATSLSDGKPVEGMDIEAYSSDRKVSLKGKTDRDGLVMVTMPPADASGNFPDLTVVATKGSQLGFSHSTWAEGVNPWNFNLDYRPMAPKYFMYISTDRPIYRPGHDVYFKGILRLDADAKLLLPDQKRVHIEVNDGNGNKVLEKDLPVSSNGTFDGTFKVAENAATGDFSIVVTLPDSKEPEWMKTFYQSFKIAEYRKPEYELLITPDKKTYISGDKAKVKVKGAFFFGAPLPDAEVNWNLRGADYYFSLPTDSGNPYADTWFSFSEDGVWCEFGCTSRANLISSGKGKLDKNGELEIDLPLDVSKQKLSQIYTLEVSVSDLSGQSISGRSSFPVQQGEYNIGVRGKDYVIESGKPSQFEILSVDANGKAVNGVNVDVTVAQRNWNTIKKKNVDGGYYYENSFEDKDIETQGVRTNDKGFAGAEFTFNKGGMYVVKARSSDGRGNKITSSSTFYVTSAEYVNWGIANNDRMELILDKNEYKIGDTAKILVKSPYKNVYALVTYERGSVLEKRIVLIDSNSYTLEIPVTDRFLPNAFVSVLIMKGDRNVAGLNEPALSDADERGVAAFKLGYATLQVDSSGKKLMIEVKPNQVKYRPGDEVTLEVKTTDIEGKAVKADVSVSVVDKSVLSLLENVTADLVNEFYRQRALGVGFATSMTKAISRVNVQVEAGMKGGGGGGIAKRGEFKDTAYYQARLLTDDNGNGVVKFKLPDNLTTWQVLAIGVSDESRGGQVSSYGTTLVGSQRQDFVSTKDVLVRPVLPRFLISKDTLTVSAIVHNYLDRAMDFEVALEATGVQVKNNSVQKVNLKPGEEKKINFEVEVLNSQNAKFIFKAANGNIGDIVEINLQVNEPSMAEFVSTNAVIQDETKHIENVILPSGIDKNFGKLTMQLSSTLIGPFENILEYLQKSPYGGTEQVSSALLGNLASKELSALKLTKPAAEEQKSLENMIQGSIESLYKLQKASGGFGLWQESKEDPYLSAYVLFTFNRAEKNGFKIDNKVRNLLIGYLKNQLNATNAQKFTRPDGTVIDSAEEIRTLVNKRAYLLFVMSDSKLGDLGYLQNLYDRRAQLNLVGKIYLALGYANVIEQLSLSGNSRSEVEGKITQLKNDVLNKVEQTPRGASIREENPIYSMFDSNERTMALTLNLLQRIDENNAILPKLLESLLKERQNGHFATTQENAIALLSLLDYFQKSGELNPSFNGVATVNEKGKLNSSFTAANIFEKKVADVPLSELLGGNSNNEVAVFKNGNGRLYFDMTLQYFLPLAELVPRNEGLEVTQQYFRVEDEKEENAIVKAKVGDNLKGKITIMVPEDRYYVMVEDFLPAGLEGVDFTLNTSQQGLQDEGEVKCMDWECYQKNWYFNHSEVRDDRMMYFADYLPKGVYEIRYFVRATSSGKFADLPTMAKETYFPEVFGRNEGRVFSIDPVSS